MPPAHVHRRRYVKRILAKRNRYQFGQPARQTTLVGGGTVACTDVALQLIIWMVLRKRVSLNRIRRISRGPTDGSRGLRPSEVMRVFRHFGLPYTIRTDITAGQAMRIARNKGPVIVAELYWAHPQWRGYRYLGRWLNGWAHVMGRRIWVGWARPRRKAGKTQSNFNAGHAVLLAWAMLKSAGDPRTVAGVRDSNHNSRARPERPKWDEVTWRQLDLMMKSIRPAYGGKKLVYVPYRRVLKKGEG